MPGWYDNPGPIRVEHGIRARSKRGSIGQRWWSRRFIDILEGVCDPGRLTRGRAYARRGQVVRLDLAAGLVTADVQGSRPEPYAVRVAIDAYGRAEWAEVERALAAEALYRAGLLAGEMPTEIVEVFDALGLPLFPAELDMHCSCPDPAHPCKHLSAVLYLLAEAFDDDPFLVLAWRGRPRDALLDALRGLPAADEMDDAAGQDPLRVDDVPLATRLADFYSPSAPLSRLTPRPTPSTPPDILLRALEPPPIKVRHIPLLDILRPAYRRLSE